MSIQQAVVSGTDTLQEPEILDREDRMEREAKAVKQELLKASLSSWVMKPLVATAGMKEGSINKAEFLKALLSFVASIPCVEAGTNNSVTSSSVFGNHGNKNLRIDYIKSLGLVCRRSNEMLGDSPDGLCGLLGVSNDIICAVVEIKTITSPRTIEDAKKVADIRGRHFNIIDIGTSIEGNGYFQEAVPSTAYRLQCLHHAIVFGVEHVLFVVAKGSSMGTGQMLYAAPLQFSQVLRSAYQHCLEQIQLASFKWVGLPSSSIPHEYDDMLQASFASDLHSSASFYGLSMAYKKLVRDKGMPLHPARMIRPTLLVYWNYLKGGMHEYSRAMMSLIKNNTSANPIVSIIGGIL